MKYYNFISAPFLRTDHELFCYTPKNFYEPDNKSSINGGVKITIEPDFKKFNCENFSEDMKNLILRRLTCYRLAEV
jgi:hypothetical protein